MGAKEMAQGLGRLGFAATALDWERPFLGPLHAWSSAVAGKPGKLTLPTMLESLWSGWRRGWADEKDCSNRNRSSTTPRRYHS